MQTKLMGWMAALALIGTPALADRGTQQPRAETQMEENQLTGRITEIREDTLFVQTEDGAVVPLQVTHETTLEGKRIERGARVGRELRNQYREGEEVRASFELRGKTQNHATSIEKAEAMMEQPMEPMEQPMEQQQ